MDQALLRQSAPQNSAPNRNSLADVTEGAATPPPSLPAMQQNLPQSNVVSAL